MKNECDADPYSPPALGQGNGETRPESDEATNEKSALAGRRVPSGSK